MKDEVAVAAGAADQSGPAALLRNNLLMTALWSIVGGHRPHVGLELTAACMWGDGCHAVPSCLDSRTSD